MSMRPPQMSARTQWSLLLGGAAAAAVPYKPYNCSFVARRLGHPEAATAAATAAAAAAAKTPTTTAERASCCAFCFGKSQLPRANCFGRCWPPRAARFGEC